MKDHIKARQWYTQRCYMDDVIDRIKGSIDIRKETEEAYKALDDDKKPYHIIFRG